MAMGGRGDQYYVIAIYHRKRRVCQSSNDIGAIRGCWRVPVLARDGENSTTARRSRHVPLTPALREHLSGEETSNSKADAYGLNIINNSELGYTNQRMIKLYTIIGCLRMTMTELVLI